MRHKTSRKRSFLIIILIVVGTLLTASPLIWAQTRTHVVVRGDTLWDICEKYYGDPELWPKLWEMNPFVTNPHLLEPGDVITLIEGMPFKESYGKEGETLAGEGGRGPGGQEPGALSGRTGKEPGQRTGREGGVDLSKLKGGIDIGSYINVKNLGFLSRSKVSPVGRIFAGEKKNIMYHEGETVFVLFDDNVDVRPGDEFTVARSSKLLELPGSGKNMGYAITFTGQIVIETHAAMNKRTGEPIESKPIYQATITENFRSIDIDDMVLPYEPVSSCIEPTPVEGQFIDKVAAGKDGKDVLGEMSVVYFRRGFNQGVREGNLFELVKANRVPNPHMGDTSYTSAHMLPRTKVNLPDLTIGIILIIDTRPDTSTGLVLSSTEEFFPGATIRAGYTKLETTGYLANVPICGQK
jgi:LysM repeat protein